MLKCLEVRPIGSASTVGETNAVEIENQFGGVEQSNDEDS